MGDTACELAHGFHYLRLDELFLDRFGVGNVFHGHDDPAPIHAEL